MAEFLVIPKLDIEFQLPMDVEFGMTDEVAVDPAVQGSDTEVEPVTPDPTPEGQATSTPQEAAEDPPAPKPAPKPKPRKPQPVAAATQGSEEASRLPAGAQIAVRVDMTRIRRSPIAEDVRHLLAAIPDWKALLDGSGIDPVEQLDRFMIATPNLQRSKIIVAGRYLGSEQVVLDAVARLAEAQGTAAPFRTEHGVRVAPWANPDVTPRVIALVGPEHFTISREEDLPRILAIAAARVAGSKAQAEEPAKEHPADALLSMEENEGLSVEVEGAEQFVRRATAGVPTKLRLSAVEKPGPLLELRGRLSFADPEKAAEAAQFWDKLREKYGQNMLVAVLGLADPLKRGSIVTKGSEVLLTLELQVPQAQLILGYLRELVRPPSPLPDNTAAPSPAPQAPAPAP